MKALIAGGGIAGLATGIALRQAGLEVDISERSPALREIGAGLMIWPNGTRALSALEVEVKALTLGRIDFRNWRGREIMHLTGDSVRDRYGSDIAFVHRADLQSALAQCLDGARLHLGQEVLGFEDDGSRVNVRFTDGTATTCDVLIGADGLRSAVRRQVLGDDAPVYLGSTIWRGISASDGIALPSGVGANWVGRGAEFVAFHLPDQRIYWAAVTMEPEGEKAGPQGHKEDLLSRFRTWCAPVLELISATPAEAILRNDMYDRPTVRTWSVGRVTLVGDAAHPMTPNSGQGACQALEDALALGDSVKRAADPAGAFRLYENRRLRRANRIVAMSRQGTRSVQIENPFLCAFRDAFGRLLPNSLILRLLDPVLMPQSG